MIVNRSDHVQIDAKKARVGLRALRACGSQCRHVFWLCAQSLLRALDVAQARALANQMGILRRAHKPQRASTSAIFEIITPAADFGVQPYHASITKS